MTNTSDIGQETTTIFLPIPRTAGTTLHRIIELQYPQEEVFFIESHNVFIDIGRYRALSEEQRAGIRMLKGHMPFGLHKYVPGPSTYFTVLRDPIERVISLYYFVLREPKHYLYNVIASKNLDLQTTMERENPIMWNDGQVRMISGVWGEPGFGECDRDTLELAKKNLREHFAVVGITERFDETLFLLKENFDWQNSIKYQRRNVTENRPRRSELSPEAFHTISQANQLDIELYKYAKKLFREQLRRRGLRFAIKSKAFKAHMVLDRLYWEFCKVSIRTLIKKWIRRLLDQQSTHREFIL